MLDLIARTTAAPHNQIPEPFRDMFYPNDTNLTRQSVEEGFCWSICPEADNLSP
jgi:hypothetical protein